MILATVTSKYNGAVFTALRGAIPEGIESGLANGGEIVRMNAMSIVLDGHSYNGSLAQSIHYEPGRMGTYKFSGYVKTKALPQATTLEFGTGQYAENGNGSAPWFVHESQAPGLGQYYNIPHFRSKSGNLTEFYYLTGARPHPYMRPAINNKKDEVNIAVKDAVASAIRGVIP